MKFTTRRLTETALMIALATVLSIIPLGIKLPLGGTVTPFSLVPIILIGQRYDRKWAFFSAFAYSIIQAAISLPEMMGWGLNWQALLGSILLDYLLAYTSIGIAGLFRKKEYSVVFGTIASVFVRFLCHWLSGIVVFSAWINEDIAAVVGDNLPIYSAAYNGIFMGPELAITLLGAVFIPRIMHAIGGRKVTE